ncbi:MAG: BspA family leucine-rich repeat surface protein [Adlercreutzia sp.]|nr:BspA family leucine-rich repeat surface protein [Adlercreutzia sp.]
MEKVNGGHQEKNRGLLFAVTVLLCVAGLFATVLDYDKAWADDTKVYGMVYKNEGSYTYTLVFQTDNAPDPRYGGQAALAEEHEGEICDSSHPTGDCCYTWRSWWLDDVAQGQITKVVVRDAIAPHDTSSWFQNYSNVTSMDLSKLDTSKVVDMSNMFEYCGALKEINVSHFKTQNTTNMSYMFEGCDGLTALDLSSFDMRMVKSATSMLPSYTELSVLKVGNLGVFSGLFPEPDNRYLEGATGKWINSSGAVFSVDSVPNQKADTYKAQRGYSVSNMEVYLSDYTFTYSGAAIKPTVSVYLNYDKELKQGVDYSVTYKNNVNAGKASVTVVGKGNYSGTATETFTIEPLSFDGSSVGKISSKVYSGKAIKPIPTVRVNGKTLKVNQDFTLEYLWNKNVGTASVYVTGKGNYSGYETAYFKITKAKQPMTVKANAKKAKAKTLKKKAVVLSKTVTVKKAKGKVTYKNVSTQKAAKKFKVNAKTGKITLSKGTKKGTYKVKIKATAAGNSSYKAGSKTVTVKVVVK